MKQFCRRLMDELDSYLVSCGGKELEGLFLYQNTGYFLAGSSVCGAFMALFGFFLSPLAGAVGFVLGLFAPAVLLSASDARDNKAILKDMKWLYETVTVQLQAGLHIQQALSESEALLKNKRLKKALHKMIVCLMRGDDLDMTLEGFERSFRNPYINSFCLILRQMKESGYAVKLLEDIRVQMEEMERMELKKKKEALEMELQIFQLLLFLGILVMVMYGCVSAVLKNMNFL